VAGAGRLLVILGLVASLGLVVLRWGVAGPAWAQGGLVPPGRPDDAAEFRARARPPLGEAARGWWAGWLAAGAAWCAGVVLVAWGTLASLGAGIGGLGTLLGDARLGTALLVLAVAWAASLAAGLVLRRRPEGGAPLPPPAWGAALAVPAAAGLWALSWSGHASSGNDRTLNVGADLLHNLATAAWVGGLLGLVLLLVPAGLRLGEADRVRLVAPGIVRFSALAIGCVAVLAVTGVYRALAELSSLSDLVDTAYGRALTVKLGLFAVLLAAGAYNRLVLHPRLERAALGLSDGERGATAALGRSVRAELLLAFALLVAVAVLLGTAPPA
jgi:copper transport protein